MSESNERIRIMAALGEGTVIQRLEQAKRIAAQSVANMGLAIEAGQVSEADVAFWGAQQAQAEAAISQAQDVRQGLVVLGAIDRELATIRGTLQLSITPQLEAMAASLATGAAIASEGVHEAERLNTITNEGLSQMAESLKLGAQRLGELAQHTDPQRGEALAERHQVAAIEGHLSDLAKALGPDGKMAIDADRLIVILGEIMAAFGEDGQPVRALWALKSNVGDIKSTLSDLRAIMAGLPAGLDGPELFQVLQGIMDQLEAMAQCLGLMAVG